MSQFQTGARVRSGSYVIKPHRSVLDVNSGFMRDIPGLRVQIREHLIDVDAQAEAGAFDEYCHASNSTREEVVELIDNFLRNHRDFGRVDGRGIYISQVTKQRAPAEQGAVAVMEPLVDAKLVCTFAEYVGEEVVQCEKEAEEGSDFCAEHGNLVETL